MTLSRTVETAERPPGDSPAGGRVATLVALAAVVVIGAMLALWFRGEVARLYAGGAAQNTALVDATTTDQVRQEITAALEIVYSYDFRTLDEDEQAGLAQVTGAYADEYRLMFDQVRTLAAQQRAVVTATVSSSAVRLLDGDRAVLVVFLDQRGTQGSTGEPIVAAGRMTVTAQRVEGHDWRIADLVSH